MELDATYRNKTFDVAKSVFYLLSLEDKIHT